MSLPHPFQLVLIVTLTSLSSCSKVDPVPGTQSLPKKSSKLGTAQKIVYPAADRRPHLKTGTSDTGELVWLVDSGATASFLITNGNRIPGVVLYDQQTRKPRVHGLFANSRSGNHSFKYSIPGQPTIQGHTLETNAPGRKIRYQGIIGLHTLKKNNAILSIRRKQLIWNAHSEALPHVQLLTHPTSGHLIISVGMNGASANFIVDTGAARSLISRRTAAKLGLRLRSAQHSVSGFYGSSKVTARADAKLQLQGSSKINVARFLVADMRNITNVRGMGDIDGLIGFDFLQRHFTAIDFGKSRMYLKN